MIRWSVFVIGGDVFETVVVEVPPVDTVVIVGVDPPEEEFEISLDHLLIEEHVGIEVVFDPATQFTLVKDVAVVLVIL